ncbi:caffeoylshikimate esterase [Ricinus communis]|uniref:Monoglyceride lipase, putative n=1 Tax=Ricinus communis TaxID=3988 RepID=B9S5Y4_RICCO|nr:caffeoylshikimate esterase [Ricinus communis]EEF40893.1 Monoglyceride lipase, putative [Ricinus communis]|eukprot:XP_002521403.1 caffeoylshikimate esterase [Ricinus communis]
MEEQQNLSTETELHYWGKTPEEEYYKQQGIRASHSSYTSPRGLSLFTRRWFPDSSSPPRSILCMVHGYGNDISWTFQSTAIFLAQMGFACFGIDIEGHGRSQGLKGYVPNVDLVVQDCLSFFNFVRQEDPILHGLPSFLYGESMGGAICLLIHLANPNGFDGAILVAPMCKIADDMKPRWPIPEVLSFVAKFLPTLAIVPTADVLSKSIKVEKKKKIGQMNPMRYREKPRLGTVMELLRVTEYLSKRICDVSIPFIVLHGRADVVTDPNVSKALYEEAKSEDKTIKIYDGMMHSLLFGETDENIETVRRDILSWLNERCKGTY